MSKILIADDDPLLVRLVAYKLEAQGHRVLQAADGEAALAMAGEHAPDLIVLDGMMPSIDGFEVLRRLKESAVTRDIPVIMLTARRLEKDVVAGLTLGARDYLVKPFIPEELIARLNGILGAVTNAKKVST